MRESIKLITTMLVMVFISIDSSYLFCLHSSALHVDTLVENVINKAHNEKESHESKKDNHDPFHDIHHYTLNTVDTSVKIDSPLSGMGFITESILFDASAAVIFLPLIYLQQKFKFPTLKSRLYFISSLLI